ncbi:MAG: hypothetical protein JWO94_2583 [Verrucomicrobiaceae bacterium]|nr:hypothetical protein [Verrucomicrobiaceae bacterium]
MALKSHSAAERCCYAAVLKFILPCLRRPWLAALLVFTTAGLPVAWTAHRLATDAVHRDQERLHEMALAVKEEVFARSAGWQRQMLAWRKRIETGQGIGPASWRDDFNSSLQHGGFRLLGIALWDEGRLKVRFTVAADDGQPLPEGTDLAGWPAVRAALAAEPLQVPGLLTGSRRFEVPGAGERVLTLASFLTPAGARGVLFGLLVPEDLLEPVPINRQRLNPDGSKGELLVQAKFLPGAGEGLLRVRPVNDADWPRVKDAAGLQMAFSLGGPLGSLNLVCTPGPRFARDSLSGEARLFGGAGLVVALLLSLLAWVQARQRGLLATEVQARTADLARTRDELRTALDHERELVGMKSHFVNMVSHEFRTPLSIILSSADILAHYLDRLAPEQRAQHLRDIQDSSQHMSRMLEQVLDLGRIDAGKLSFDPRPVDLASLLARIADESQSASGGGGIQLKTDHGLEGARADESLLRHVLLNLISNARKYSAPASLVEVTASRNNESAVIMVHDHGIGIPAADLPHMFEAFARGGNVAATPGTGLGLSIVQRCVTLHGGSIQLASQEGRGTTVTVRLPLFPHPLP